MTERKSTGGPDLSPTLNQPPRLVPLRLRLQLFSNKAVLFGAIWFGVFSIFALLCFLPSEMLRCGVLAVSRQPAEGQLIAIEKTVASEGRSDNEMSRVHRYRYSYRPPNGNTYRGFSYTTGVPHWAQALRARLEKGERPPVNVNYNSWMPTASVIEDTRASRLGYVALFAYVFPLIGVASIILGVVQARRTVRLLRHGLPAQAAVKTCRRLGNKEYPEQSPDEFAERWRKQQVYRQHGVESISKDAPPEDASSDADSPESKSIVARFKTWISAWIETLFVWIFGWWVNVIFAVGAVFLLVFLGLASFGDDPMVLKNAEFGDRPLGRGAAVLFSVVFLLLWCGAYWVMRYGSRRLHKMRNHPDPALEVENYDEAECKVEFTLPSGETVEAQTNAVWNEELGGADGEPILYDNDDPQRVCLLRGLHPRIRPTSEGGWEFERQKTALRIALILSSCVVGPVAGLAIGSLLG